MHSKRIRVAFVDDNALARQALANRLNIYTSIQVVGEAENGTAALQLAHDLQPDIFLVDVNMPGLNGLELTRRLSQELPNVGVVILTVKEMLEPEDVFDCGARGFLLKYDLISELEPALLAVSKGQRYLSKRLQNEQNNGAKKSCNLTEAIDALAMEDRKFLKQLLTGKSVRESSAALGISAARGAILRQRIMDCLGVRSMGSLIRMGVEQRNGISERLPSYMLDEH
ncbi:MAG: response regulator transcription factor [Motiliproteus sp.]|nr:response regulator transcription factor [Motiliproteus sp.]MCW9052063.1 response regulator transcription factor [Motiliproteus sp.]